MGKWRKRQIAKEEKQKAAGDDQKCDGEKEKKKKRRYMFDDFDVKNWANVNIYNQGFVSNLYYAYFPYADVQKTIQNEKKKKKKDDVSIDDEDEDVVIKKEKSVKIKKIQNKKGNARRRRNVT